MENVLDGDTKTLVVFSDLDGTLIHYPDKPPKNERHNTILKLPPSSTGMRGIISSKTLSKIQDIRKKGAKFVLVSGMRTSTFLQRAPFLPRADAYCTEAGGRIFYPVEAKEDGFVVKPQKYDGCTDEDLEPFSLAEDMQWRSKMERITGNYGLSDLKELAASPDVVPDLNERDGLLWDYARFLTSKGFVVDTKGYSACFRVNKKQQTSISDEEFDALTNGEIKVWDGLGTSINLSCVDYYSAESGKKNCCQYLAEKYCPDANDETVLGEFTVCLCDDDNDVQMANACRHAYIPEVTSEHLAEAIEEDPDHFTVTSGRGAKRRGHAVHGHKATEAALSLILDSFPNPPPGDSEQPEASDESEKKEE